MTSLLRIPLFCFVVFMLSSCMKLGINIYNKTPSKAAKLPAFTHADSLLGYNNSKRSAFDVTHYDIDLKINPTTKSIAGKVTTRFMFNGEGNSNVIQLDLAKQLIIDSIIGGAESLSYTRDEQAVFITLKSTKTEQSVCVYYHGIPKPANRPPWEGGMVWKKTPSGVDFCGVSCEGDGAQIWLPVKVWLGDEPDSADMHFTVPAPLVAVSNGVLKGIVHKDSLTTYHWKTRYPINTYNITFYLADYQLFEKEYTYTGGTTSKQQFFVLPQHLQVAQHHFNQVDSVLQVYEKKFGTYAWQKEPYKLVESPYEGMEHQTAIAYGSGFKNRGQIKDYIIVHETAHEWWGNALSVADFRDVWLHEGFATYSEAVFVEEYYGYNSYLNYMRSIYFTIMNRKPVRGPEGVYYWNYKDGDLYMKGAATLHALRSQMQNDKLFFEILSTFYSENIGKIVTTEQFISLVNQKTGKDYQPLFTQFLDNRASIKMNYKIVHDTKQNAYFLEYDAERLVQNFEPKIKLNYGGETMYVDLKSTKSRVRLPGSDLKLLQVNTDNFYLQVHKN